MALARAMHSSEASISGVSNNAAPGSHSSEVSVSGVFKDAAPGSHSSEAIPPALSREDMLAAKMRPARVVQYQRARPPFLSNISLAILSGLLLVFSFPDWSLSTLAWIGVAPLIMASARERRGSRSFLLGLVTGTIFFIGSSYWVTYSMHHYGGMSLWVSYLAGLLIAMILGSFAGLFSMILSRSVSRFGGWAILAAPVLWPASEWARIQITTMGWNSLGYSQAFDPLLIQTARFGGVYLTSSLLVAVSAALVFAMVYIEKPRGLIVFTLAGVLVAANLLYGHHIRSEADNPGSVSVGVVQPNFPIAGDWEDPQFVNNMLEQLLKLSAELVDSNSEAATRDGPHALIPHDSGSARQVDGQPEKRERAIDIIIWPESPIPLEYDRDPVFQQKVAMLARRKDVYVLLNTWESPDGSGLRNSAIAVSPAGDKIFEYDKIALLPYGEFVPGKGWLPFMDRVSAVVGDVTPGKAPTLSGIAGASIGTIICFEATKPELSRLIRLMGASSIVQLSDEAWFGRSSAAKQMLAHAVFRAVENNVDLIRSTNSGMSARISRLGTIQGTTPMFETASRRWQIKSTDDAHQDSLTFYTKYGDVFAWGCAAASVLIFALGFIPEKSTIGVGRPSNKHDRRT
jgi:apolipoprotein N-acyltransferase